MLRAASNSLLSVIFPQECTVCGAPVFDSEDQPACAVCWTATRIFDGTEMLCDKCGAFLGDTAAPRPVLCHNCERHAYDKAVACGVYEKGLAASVIALKKTPRLSVRAARIVGNALKALGMPAFNLIIPIPLSKQRRLERGFNQAEIIAIEIANRTGRAVDSASLVRRANTQMHRMGMDKRARELTVEKAFEVVRPKLISGRDILLVDDVFTSGATASACAKALKGSGASRVSVFTLARAVLR